MVTGSTWYVLAAVQQLGTSFTWRETKLFKETNSRLQRQKWVNPTNTTNSVCVRMCVPVRAGVCVILIQQLEWTINIGLVNMRV